VSDGLPVHGEGPIGSPSSEEPTITTLPWYSRTLASLTLYDELSNACTPDEFATVRTRLEKEWSFNGGFVSRSKIVLLDYEFIHMYSS